MGITKVRLTKDLHNQFTVTVTDEGKLTDSILFQHTYEDLRRAEAIYNDIIKHGSIDPIIIQEAILNEK